MSTMNKKKENTANKENETYRLPLLESSYEGQGRFLSKEVSDVKKWV